MGSQIEATISAYVDAESVERGAVLAALETEEGREALIEFTRLRLLTAVEGTPGPEFYARLRAEAPVVAPPLRRPLAWTVGVGLAASLAVGFLTGAMTFGAWFARADRADRAISDTPPPAARVLEFQEGVDWHQIQSREVTP